MVQITRIEVIDENGRSYVNWKDDNDITTSYQDDGKTLKVFVNTVKPKTPCEIAYKRIYGKYAVTGIAGGSGWTFFQDGYNASKEEEYQPTPQTENEVAEGLRSAFREVQQTEEWKETQKKIDGPWMDEMVAELKGQTLYDALCKIDKPMFVDDVCRVVEEWLPKEQDSSGTQRIETEIAVEAHNELLQKIKSKLRNKKDT